MESSGLPQAPTPLHVMFTEVPPHYDLVNRIVTLGLDKRWRRLAALTCLAESPRFVLDLGCGTGDLTIKIARLAKKDIEITGLDFSTTMLVKARQKAVRAGVGEKVGFIHGEATRLPFADGYFDIVGISFAFRNLTYKNPLCLLHLTEVRRVLRTDGRYVIVESSQPESRLIRAFFHLYLRTFVKPVGMLLSGNRGAYRYLAESTARYYSPREVCDMLLASGFRDVTYHPLLFGAAGIHVAIK